MATESATAQLSQAQVTESKLAQTRVLGARLLPHITVLAAMALITIAATWPMFPNLGGYLVDKDDSLLVTWELAWQGHALATNPLGLMEANINYPYSGTLGFNEISFTESVISAPVYLATGNPVLGLNFVVFVAFILGGYGTWLLVRELTGSRWAGLAAGTAYAFSFYMLNNLIHPTILSAEWLPFILLSAYKLLWTHKWRWAGALCIFFALQALSTHYLAYYSAILLGLFIIYYFIVQRPLFSRTFWIRFLAGMVMSALLILPIALAYREVQAGYGFSRDIYQTERYSYAIVSFLSVYKANPLYKTLLAPFADQGPWPLEHAAFPGLGVLILTIIGLVWLWRRRRASQPTTATMQADDKANERPPLSLGKHAIFYVIVALVSVVLSLGPTLQLTYPDNYYDPNAINGVMPLPYLLLFNLVPGFTSMRTVSRIEVLIALSLAVLAGIGTLALLRWLGERRTRQTENQQRSTRRWVPALAILLALIPVAESWSAPLNMEPIPTRSAVPQVYRWLAAQPPAAIVEYPMVYYKTGDLNVVMGNTYQYFSTYHWDRTVNGSVTIRPFAYSALIHETDDCFPCARSVDALWALGVKYVVVHLENLSGPQLDDFKWRTTHAEGGVLDTFTLVQEFGNDQVYTLKTPGHLDQLPALIPSGASLLLGSPADDPILDGKIGGGYTAALGYYLREGRTEYGDPSLTFGQPILPADPNNLPDYALLWSKQDPTTAGYSPQNNAWTNGIVTLYKR